MKLFKVSEMIFFVASIQLLSACQSDLTTESQGGSLYAVSDSTKGADIQGADALSRLDQYCGSEKIDGYLSSITGKTIFQAGYAKYFDGSGSTYPTSKSTAPDGSLAIVRSGDAEMFSLNGMAMYPPSALFNHAEFVKSECNVARGALSNGNKYSEKFSVRTGASFAGSLSETKLNLSDCLVIDAESGNGASHTMAFCPNGFMQKGQILSSSGSDQLAQLIMQAQ